MKKLLLIFTLLFLLLVFTTPTYSQSFGLWSCGKIIQFDRDNIKIQMDLVSLFFAGYIVGRNVAEKVNKFSNADAPTLFYLLVKYCKKYPTLVSYDAATRIYNEKR